ncbi:MAG TPA: PilZ domain-containing protein [Dongiaceae bacterium]|jgi:hypothetical protein|nr:PilZ domain-containing protein [Dongiaceae bacterium]
MVDNQTIAAEGGSNRRITLRKKTLKSAKIVFNKKQSVIDCFVRDVSDTGAKLQVADLLAVPRSFTLLFNDGTSHECERVRARGTEIGVRFLN